MMTTIRPERHSIIIAVKFINNSPHKLYYTHYIESDIIDQTDVLSVAPETGKIAKILGERGQVNIMFFVNL